jgi:hypothetical protein
VTPTAIPGRDAVGRDSPSLPSRAAPPGRVEVVIEPAPGCESPSSPATPHTPAAEPKPILTEATALWERALAAAAGNRRLRVLLSDCRPVSITSERVVLEAPPEVAGAVRAGEKELRAMLCTALGTSIDLEILQTTPPAQPHAPSQPATAHPLVKKAIDLFGATLVRIQPRKDS